MLRACRFWNPQPADDPRPPVGLQALPTDRVLQQITRYRTSRGIEAIQGTLLAEFSAGQREATLYVAFCPPFERLPEVEAQVADDSSVSVKVAQRFHHGAQFEVRLTEPAEDLYAVSISFFASEPYHITSSDHAT